jgi:hypothetical protein
MDATLQAIPEGRQLVAEGLLKDFENMISGLSDETAH